MCYIESGRVEVSGRIGTQRREEYAVASETRLFGKWIKERLADRGVKTHVQIGEFYGMSSVSGGKLTQGDVNPSVSRAIDYVEPLGYALAVVPKGSKLPEGGVWLAKSKDTAKSGKRSVEESGRE